MLSNSLFCLMLCLMWLKYSSNVAVTPCQDGKASQLLCMCCACVHKKFIRGYSHFSGAQRLQSALYWLNEASNILYFSYKKYSFICIHFHDSHLFLVFCVTEGTCTWQVFWLGLNWKPKGLKQLKWLQEDQLQSGNRKNKIAQCCVKLQVAFVRLSVVLQVPCSATFVLTTVNHVLYCGF